MILYPFDDRVPTSLEEIEEKIRASVRIVKFGPLNFYNTKHQQFELPWMGEYSEKTNQFKLFRTEVGSSYTSDFYLKGRIMRMNKGVQVRYGIYAQWSLLLGLLSINVFCYAIAYLLQSKEWIQIDWMELIFCAVVSAGYIGSKVKDFRRSLRMFKDLMGDYGDGWGDE